MLGWTSTQEALPEAIFVIGLPWCMMCGQCRGKDLYVFICVHSPGVER